MQPHAHPHSHPPTKLSSEDTSLPEREILTPLGRAKFRNAELEEKGYRWLFTTGSDDEMIEVVYLKDDGSTGTLIADLDTIFDKKIISRDNIPMCLVTYKVMKSVGESVELIRAEVPIRSMDDINKTLKRPGLIDYFLEKAYGRKV